MRRLTEGNELAVDAKRGVKSGDEMEIGSFLLDHEFEEVVEGQWPCLSRELQHTRLDEPAHRLER
jgi:hypothetical protein